MKKQPTLPKSKSTEPEFGEFLNAGMAIPFPMASPNATVATSFSTMRLIASLLFGLSMGILGFLAVKILIHPVATSLFDNRIVPLHASLDLGVDKQAQLAAQPQTGYQTFQNAQTVTSFQPTGAVNQNASNPNFLFTTASGYAYQGSVGTAAVPRPR